MLLKENDKVQDISAFCLLHVLSEDPYGHEILNYRLFDPEYDKLVQSLDQADEEEMKRISKALASHEYIRETAEEELRDLSETISEISSRLWKRDNIDKEYSIFIDFWFEPVTVSCPEGTEYDVEVYYLFHETDVTSYFSPLMK